MIMTDGELIEAAGRALYGDTWQASLGRALNVQPRTIRYWLAGTYEVKPLLWAEIAALLKDRAATATDTADLIQRQRLSAD